MAVKIDRRREKELNEMFYTLISTVYTEASLEELNVRCKPYKGEFENLLSITDDVDVFVKFVCYLRNGDITHTRYQPIELFVKNGVELDKDVERYEVVAKAQFIKNGVKYQSKDNVPFFKSETFVIAERAKNQISKLMLDSVKEGQTTAIAVEEADLINKTAERIRLKNENQLEV